VRQLRRRRRFYAVAIVTTAATEDGNAGRDLHDHSDRYQLQCRRAAGKCAGHIDREVMVGPNIGGLNSQK